MPDHKTTPPRGAGSEQPHTVVGIGCSAGGLKPLQALFDALPPGTGAAFVVLQHLDPHHRSLTPELMDANTRMPLRQAEEGDALRPDEVVFLPPGASLRIEDGRLRLRRDAERGPTRSYVDVFLRSLAAARGPDTVGVLLSGSGSDGTLGLKAVQERGGLALVQDPVAAEFDGMPASAVRAGAADAVAPVAELAARLEEHLTRRRRSGAAAGAVEPPEELLGRILKALRARVGHDFRAYKRGTLRRRLQRRLQLLGLEDLERYVDQVELNPDEAEALARDLMISVTEFFLDPEAWAVLGDRVVPELFADRDPDEDVRVWVAGCATGEEAYSVAMLLEEHADTLKTPPDVTIFATDIDEQALVFAREGLYPHGIAESVSDERLERFFKREKDHFRVSRLLRERCVFARHNVLQDPPFSRLALVCCRNLLIYLERDAQDRALAVFQYALEPGGFLFLGSSENLEDAGKHFEAVDKGNRIYQRTGMMGPAPVGLLQHVPGTQRPPGFFAPPSEKLQRTERQDVRRTLEQAVLQGYGPAAVLIDERREVLHFFGRTGRYLEPSAARGGSGVLDMAPQELQRVLHMAIREAERQRRAVTHRNVRLGSTGGGELVDVTVRPAWELGRDARLLLIVLEDGTAPERSAGADAEAQAGEPPALVLELEAELRESRQRLQATIEELETSNEEMQSANEELLSMNEELQTSKEEAQSVNEELHTVNAELESKVAELAEAHGDLQNLFRSSPVATLFLDRGRRIQRFTPAATELFRLRDSDVGRPIDDIVQRFTGATFEAEIARVLDELVPRQIEVVLPDDDRWFMLRISPYRTLGELIDGVVLVFTEVTELKESELRLREERRFAQSIVETVQEPLVVLDPTLEVLTASNAFYETFRVFPDEVRGARFRDLGGGRWNLPEVQTALERVLRDDRPVTDLEVELALPRQGARVLRLNARPVPAQGDAADRVLLTLQDITEFRERERIREEEAQRKDWFLAMLGHELRNPLAAIQNANLMLSGGADLPEARRRKLLEITQRQVAHLNRLVDDLLDISRIAEGKLLIERAPLDLGQVVGETVEDHHRAHLEEAGLELDLELPGQPLRIDGDAKRIAQAVGNLLGNARKYTDRGGRVQARVAPHPGGELAEVVVEDTGAGMPPELVDRVFEPFQQGLRGPEDSEQGLGVGLTLVRTVAEAHGGAVRAESPGRGQGSRFTLWLPLSRQMEIDDGHRQAAAATWGEAVSAGHRRVLVVEDQEDAAESTRLLLETDGHEVAVAPDGETAIRLAEELRPEVVLCDLGLGGGMTGYDVARALRRHPELVRARLVAVTGFSQDKDRDQAREAGFDHFLTKPVSFQDVRRELAQALEGQRASSGETRA